MWRSMREAGQLPSLWGWGLVKSNGVSIASAPGWDWATPHQQGLLVLQHVLLGSRNEQGSMLTLGAIDQSYYTGSLHWVPVTKQQYWQFTMDRWVSRALCGPQPEVDSTCGIWGPG
jgi:hypothetical protein